jgi:Tol biopolymer transport system component
MPDVLERLEEYGRHISAVTTPTDLDAVIDRVPHAAPQDRVARDAQLTVTAPAPSRRQLPSWAIVVAAAVFALVVIGGTAWLIGGAGTVDRTPVTTPPPTTVPAGDLSTTRIAFYTAADDEGAEHYEIFVMAIDGSEVTRLQQSVEGDQALSDDSAADWSPDGTKLVFTSLRDEVAEDWNYEIYTMNADGSDQQRLTDSPGVDSFADWSPDGTRIIFEREGTNGTRDIWVMDADGTGQVNITNDPDHDYITASWSPDGTRIAFASDRDDLAGGCGEDCNLDVYVMDSDGSNLVRLTDDPAIDAFPEWSPDGSRILFHSTRAGETIAFTAPDGTVVTEPNYDVFVMHADGTGPVNLTNNPAMDGHAVWSPDGTRIAFNSSRDGNVEIYLMDPDGANLTRITTTPGLEEWWPSWSPIP